MPKISLGIGPREQFLLDLHNYRPPSTTLHRWQLGGQVFTDSTDLFSHQHALALELTAKNVSPTHGKSNGTHRAAAQAAHV